MDYHVFLSGPAPDLAPFDAALRALDPAALMDVDPTGRVVRVSTMLDERDLAGLLASSATPWPVAQIERQPSNCCGGCGG